MAGGTWVGTHMGGAAGARRCRPRAASARCCCRPRRRQCPLGALRADTPRRLTTTTTITTTATLSATDLFHNSIQSNSLEVVIGLLPLRQLPLPG